MFSQNKIFIDEIHLTFDKTKKNKIINVDNILKKKVIFIVSKLIILHIRNNDKYLITKHFTSLIMYFNFSNQNRIIREKLVKALELLQLHISMHIKKKSVLIMYYTHEKYIYMCKDLIRKNLAILRLIRLINDNICSLFSPSRFRKSEFISSLPKLKT